MFGIEIKDAITQSTNRLELLVHMLLCRVALSSNC